LIATFLNLEGRGVENRWGPEEGAKVGRIAVGIAGQRERDKNTFRRRGALSGWVGWGGGQEHNGGEQRKDRRNRGQATDRKTKRERERGDVVLPTTPLLFQTKHHPTFLSATESMVCSEFIPCAD
jgi:hypothetical protein